MGTWPGSPNYLWGFSLILKGGLITSKPPGFGGPQGCWGATWHHVVVWLLSDPPLCTFLVSVIDPRDTAKGDIISVCLEYRLQYPSGQVGEDSGIKPMGHVNDGMFLVMERDPDIFADLAQPSINIAVQCGKDNGLVFSPEKTQVILLNKRNKRRVKGNLFINVSRSPFGAAQ